MATKDLTALQQPIDRERMDREHRTDPDIHARNETIRQMIEGATRYTLSSGFIEQSYLDKITEEVIKFFYVKEDKPCELTVDVPPSHQRDYYGLWCSSHQKVANHCAPDGDSNVCDDYAVAHSCNCCIKKNGTLIKIGSRKENPKEK